MKREDEKSGREEKLRLPGQSNRKEDAFIEMYTAV
jgi:hypothetical protein